MIRIVTRSNVGCIIDGQIINLLAYADNFVVIAPSWRALQRLLSIIHSEIMTLDMTCNTKKTVCMVFRPARKERIVSSEFPLFKIFDTSIQYVDHFKYLGHFITNDMSDVALLSKFKHGSLDKLQSCYNKCIKLFFGFRRCDSLTGVLLATGLPRFDTVLCNSRHMFRTCWSSSTNYLVRILCDVSLQ